MVDGGLDWAVQFASVTPEGDVEWLTSGLGKTGDRDGRSRQLVNFFYSFVTRFLQFLTTGSKLGSKAQTNVGVAAFSECVCVWSKAGQTHTNTEALFGGTGSHSSPLCDTFLFLPSLSV